MNYKNKTKSRKINVSANDFPVALKPNLTQNPNNYRFNNREKQRITNSGSRERNAVLNY